MIPSRSANNSLAGSTFIVAITRPAGGGESSAMPRDEVAVSRREHVQTTPEKEASAEDVRWEVEGEIVG